MCRPSGDRRLLLWLVTCGALAYLIQHVTLPRSQPHRLPETAAAPLLPERLFLHSCRAKIFCSLSLPSFPQIKKFTQRRHDHHLDLFYPR